MCKIDPHAVETIQAQVMIAARLLENKRPDEAIALLDQAVKIYPQYPDIYNLRGHAWLMKNDLPLPRRTSRRW